MHAQTSGVSRLLVDVPDRAFVAAFVKELAEAGALRAGGETAVLLTHIDPKRCETLEVRS